MTNDITNTDSATPEFQPGQFAAESHNMVGQRLDFALSVLLPDMGLRGRKRCIENGLVRVNGRACTAAQRLRKSDVVTLLEPAQEPAPEVGQLAAMPEQAA